MTYNYYEEAYAKEDLSKCVLEPKIELTIEETEILTRCAAHEFCRLIMEQGPVDLIRQVEVLMYDLTKRIAQAKYSKICDNYSKALNKVVKKFQKQEEEIIQLKCEIDQLKTEQELDNWLKKTGF